ncbi:hypothetical protein AB0L30_31595 [Microbispora rosea]
MPYATYVFWGRDYEWRKTPGYWPGVAAAATAASRGARVTSVTT